VVSGVTIHRIAKAPTGPHNLLQRAFAYFAYYRGARDAARRMIRPGDVVVAKTDPPLLSAAIGPLCQRLGAKVIVWLQDVFPETAHVYGVPGAGRITGAWLRHIRNRSLAKADRVVAIAHRMARRVEALGCVAADRLIVIHNWADADAIVPIEARDNEKRKQLQLNDKFVVAYSGNFGRVHEFETLLGAAKRLQSDSQISFLLIGRGPRLSETQARAKREQLNNVRFEPLQDRSALAQTLSAPDVHVSVLRPEYEGLVHPSKLYGIMAAGRPTIFIGDRDGETAAILAASGCGITVETGDVDALVAAIRNLRDDAALRAQMGRNARKTLEERYSKRHGLEAWERILGAFP